MRRVALAGTVLLAMAWLFAGDAFAKKPTAEPGQQTMTARWTNSPPSIDGTMGPGEYSAAIPLHVVFNSVELLPGFAPGFDSPPEAIAPDNPNDLSFTAYAVYDEDNLYIAVDVADDILCDDGAGNDPPDQGDPYIDDGVELFFDGDQVDNDFASFVGNEEGFQLAGDIGGAYWSSPHGATFPDPDPIDWVCAAGLRPRGFVIEYEVALTSIDMTDGSGEANPAAGASIGFNIAVNDDDNGGYPYNFRVNDDWTQWDFLDGPPYDTYGRWDGTETAAEAQWGTLYFEPRSGRKNGKPVAAGVESATWGQIKGQSK
jgi:hypothetical protein